MQIIPLLILSLIAWWVYIDARKRGRSEGVALFWAVGTFLILIIFLPLWLMWGRFYLSILLIVLKHLEYERNLLPK